MKKESKSEFVLLGQPIIDINRQKVEELLYEILNKNKEDKNSYFHASVGRI